MLLTRLVLLNVVYRRRKPHGERISRLKTLSGISVTQTSMSVRVCVRPSGKFLVGPSSTSSTILSSFIRQGHTGRCYGGGCVATDESNKNTANVSCQTTESIVGAPLALQSYRWHAASTEAFALLVIVAGFGRAPKTFSKRVYKRVCSRLAQSACRANSA
jgi:hypothetical protein